MSLPEGKILVLFDGMCILCSGTIRFLLKADRRKKFLFKTLQSSTGKESDESVMVNDGTRLYTHFDAVMKIGKELGGIYRLVGIFGILPREWRLRLYQWIARNRYRWFGKRQSCFLPTAEDKARFI
ncbi:MAG: DUF393 domain-containing protein [Verrucomicrobia bacterium]|nr:DUF393 domain-containing protein [Prolixibacteraceae bacterium]